MILGQIEKLRQSSYMLIVSNPIYKKFIYININDKEQNTNESSINFFSFQKYL